MLLTDLEYSLDWVLDASRTVGWGEFCIICHNLRNYLSDDEIIEISRASLEGPQYRTITLFARHFLTVREVYYHLYKPVTGALPKHYGGLETTIMDIGPGQLQIDVTGKDNLECPRGFCLGLLGQTIEAPELLGFPSAEVSMIDIPNGVRFTVAYPVRGGILAPLRQALMRPFTSRRVTFELHEALEEKYRALEGAMQKLRDSEANYKLLAQNAHDVIWTTDLDGKFTYVSPSVERMLGFTPDEVVGLQIFDGATSESREIFASLAQHEQSLDESAFGEKNRSHILEIKQYHKNGSLIDVEIVTSYILDHSGKPEGVLGVSRDISQRKRAEAHEAKLEQQLLQAQKIESLGTLAGGIAHDFNNILQVILGFSNLAIEQGKDNEVLLSKCLREIEKGGRRAADLVDQILTFSRKSGVELEIQKLHPLVAEATKFIRNTLPTTIRIELSADSSCDTVKVNGTQIHQVVTNLCTNAAHAMEDAGGVLCISLKQIVVDSALETLSGRIEAGDYLQLRIADTGVGIEPDVMQQVLDPFFTTKEVGKGTGLGLATVHGIVHNVKGGLSIKSELGAGTTVQVLLPVVLDSAQVSSSEHSPRAVQTNTAHILLVDDEEPITTLSTLILERHGFTVGAYNDSARALEAVRDNTKKYDVAILDYTMPKMTGLEMAKALNTLQPGLSVILATGLLEKTNLEQEIPGNVTDIIRKPFDADVLVAAINATL